MTANKVPYSFSAKFGGITTRRGLMEKLKLFSWDVIPKCPQPVPDDNGGSFSGCPAVRLCSFEKSSDVKEIKCGVTSQYLRGTAEMLFNNFAHVLAEDEFYRLGMHLMPLYRMLVKLKIAELGIERAITTTSRGIVKANPIYKEIRETIKSIEMMWSNLDLTGPRKKGGKTKPIPMPGDLDMTPTQDYSKPGSYYEAMASGKHKTEKQIKEEIKKAKLNLRK